MGRRHYSGHDVEKALSIEDLRQMARRRVPGFVFEYLEGGAEDEVTLRRNRTAFHQLEFVPRTLVRSGSVDPSKLIFGSRSSLPVVIAPTGFCGLFARDGDLCLANAAASAGIPFVQSIVSNALIESVAKTAGLRHWMQIYVFRSPAFTEQLVARALAADCEALVITTDATVYGNREWDRRNYARGTDPTFTNKLDILRHPRWMMDVLAKEPAGFSAARATEACGCSDMVAQGGRSRFRLGAHCMDSIPMAPKADHQRCPLHRRCGKGARRWR
jgi:(S)-mandelate dehydrogenase